MRLMIIIFLIILALLPVLLLGYYIYKKDSEKEPKSLLIEFFLAGLIGSVLMIIFDIIIAIVYPELYVFSNSYKAGYFLTFILIFLEVGLLEEAIKWFFIRIVGYNSPEFDQIYDIIVYCVFVALGFAFFENLFYVLQGGIRIGILRGLLSVPAHAVYGVFMGYFLGKAKISKTRGSNFKYIFLSIFIPSVLHGIYDYILMFEGNVYFCILIVYMAILYFTAFKIVDKLSKEKKHLDIS